MTGPEQEPLVVEQGEDGVLRLTLNRPAARNALSPELTTRLVDELTALDASVRVVVLAGAGEAFCAGGDLGALEEAVRGDFGDAYADGERFDRLFHLLDSCPVPVVALVDGPAIGGGTGLAACADLVVASTRATFGCSEVRVGILPAIVAPYVVAKIGPGHARRFLLSGERFDVRTAEAIGLVHVVVAPDDLAAAGERAVAGFLAAHPAAQRATKRLLRLLALGAPPELTSALTALETARVRVSEEGRRGLAAMLDRVGSGRRR
jgi:methylglutaconyl-CoA hydratase